MPSQKPADLVERGVKVPSPFNRALFTGLRIAVVPFSYLFLATPTIPRFLSILGLQTITTSTPLLPLKQAWPALISASTRPSDASLSAIGLSTPRALLLCGSVLAAAKQIWYAVFVQQETLSLGNALYIPAINFFPELIQATLYFARISSTATSSGEHVTLPIALGATMFAFGVAVEWLSELQRKRFKDDPRIRGKVYRDGLFAYARHINFAGFSLWKSAGPMMSVGWTVGVCMIGFFLSFFHGTAIPPLDLYCQERYKEQWTRYKREVPSSLVPGLW